MSKSNKQTKLVIVESPTKARTITRFLGNGFTVLASMGHVRDLPKSKLGVDVNHNFEPSYIVPLKARAVVATIKKAVAEATQIYFATDEDREGEAIAWHLQELLKLPAKETNRIVFHEITKTAINKALDNPRQLNKNLVDAQQARRVLDRLVGYELSPFLWRKVQRGLSAGRVQSVALRLIVEREREIQQFVKQEYWTIEAEFLADQQTFPATLRAIKGKSLDKFEIKTNKDANQLVEQIKQQSCKVSELNEQKVKRVPPTPFTTSTMQQDANRRLHFSVKQTMMIAQQLYEGVELGAEGSTGLITYMRTDSVNLAEEFLAVSQKFINNQFGDRYTLAEPRRFKTKSKNAQEAHEAIRPTDPTRTPSDVAPYLTPPQLRLYELIWQRAVASQMPEAEFASTSADINSQDRQFTFRATGNRCTFNGFLKVYLQKYEETTLPPLQNNQSVDLNTLTPTQHFTEPPARYSEATLVKALEANGIGRPSTYAPTIGTLIERRYIERKERRLYPNDIGMTVNDLLVKHFPEIVDFDFTAKMEQELDDVAEGQLPWPKVMAEFYQPFKEHLTQKEHDVSRKEFTEQATDQKCPECGSDLIIKLGRYGKFLACKGYPECKFTQPIKNDKEESESEKDAQATMPEETNETCPGCQEGKLVKRRSRYGYFLGCSRYPECKYIKKENKSTGVKCPQCHEGELVTKKGRGKIFYSCSRYPDCKCALWAKPLPENCPTCGWPLINGGKNVIKCSRKGCDYKK